MKLFLLVMLFMALLKADECPAKVLKIASDNINSYFKTFDKKAKGVKINCSYEHNSSLFNLEHQIKAQASYKKRKLNFFVKTHSSLFNLFDFSDLDGKICHNKVDKVNTKKDIAIIKKNFLKTFAKDISDKQIQRTDRNGQVCYSAKVNNKKRTLI